MITRSLCCAAHLFMPCAYAGPASAPPLIVDRPAQTALGQPPPTFSNIPYGRHDRQVLDFWQAASSRPTPVLFYIHGGGWLGGDKAEPRDNPVVGVDIARYLTAGISIVSINYRYISDAMAAGVRYPVEWPMHDAARALQFVRSKATTWNIDKQRIAASGGSAGACTSLWLAFHDDLADLQSSDPISRESTRLWCAAVLNAQTTLDPRQMVAWTPNSRYGGHAFGFMDPTDRKTRDSQFPQFLAARDRVWSGIKTYSPYEHVTNDDPPIYMFYLSAPAFGEEQKDPTHTANFGVGLAEKLRQAGVTFELVHPAATGARFATLQDFLTHHLMAPDRRAQTRD